MNINKRLLKIYEDPAKVEAFISLLDEKLKPYKGCTNGRVEFSEKDSILITYGDSIVGEEGDNIQYLHKLLKKFIRNKLSAVHILPMFPYTSDDGFSVVDYKAINESVGTWSNIEALGKDYDLMFDAVINHISASSEWFKKCLSGDEKYQGYFIENSTEFDASKVVRPRTSNLFTPFDTSNGQKEYWTTFSADQLDVNYESIDLATDIIELLAFYASKGSKYIRLDAIGFLWKESGSTCIHHDKTHEMIKVMREVLDDLVPGTKLVTETNVPHKENISYFGNGHDEAQMVYQFPLPPLTLFSFLKEDATKLSEWANSLEPLTDETTYFNFLASHDGVGLRPTEGILTDEERNFVAKRVLTSGGRINYRSHPDGSKSPYELNISYQDALSTQDETDETRMKKFVASQCILLSVVGIPGVYIHSLLGSRNDYYGVETSGINRRINREKLDYNTLVKALEEDSFRSKILGENLQMLEQRKGCKAFHPNASQEVLFLDKRVFSIVREDKISGEKVTVLINVSSETVNLDLDVNGTDLISGACYIGTVELEPFARKWIKA